MPTPADTTITITHSKIHTTTTTTTPKDGPDFIAILTLILPVLTFLAGYRLNSWYEKRKERERLNDIKQYYLTLLRAIIKPINRQSEVIQDIITGLHNMTSERFVITNISSFRTNRIKSIPDIDLYKIFISDKTLISKRVEQLNKISSNLDFIDDIRGQINEINANMGLHTQDFYTKYFKLFNNIISKRNIIVEAFSRGEHNNDYNLKNLIANIDQHIIGKDGTNLRRTYTIAETQELITEPLITGIIDIHINETNKDIMLLINRLKQPIKGFEVYKEVTIKLLSEIVMNLNNISTEISSVTLELSS